MGIFGLVRRRKYWVSGGVGRPHGEGENGFLAAGWNWKPGKRRRGEGTACVNWKEGGEK